MFIKRFLTELSTFSIVLCATNSFAQEVDLMKIKEELKSFSSLLEESLGFRDGAALFGMNRGTVNSTYLYGQGILLEIRTPLANERNRLQLTSLQSAMRALQVENPFEQFLLQNSPNGFARINSDEDNSFYRRLLNRIDTIDSTLTFSVAIQQATDSLRLLRELESIKEIEYEGLRTEIQGLQARMDESVLILKKLEEDVQVWFVGEGNDLDNRIEGSTPSESYFNERLDAVIENIQPLENLAVGKAEQLGRRAELAEKSYLSAWQGEVLEFELGLFEQVCDSKLLSHLLPKGEYLTFVLKGIGDESTGVVGANADKLHVLNKSDLDKCQTGIIVASELLELSRHYSM